MKKLFIISIFIIVFLSGCFGGDYPKDIEAQKLYDQYNDYIQHDISSYDRLQTFINEVSLSAISINVIVEVKTFNQDDILVDSKKHSGFVYLINNQNFDVITINSNQNLPLNYTEQNLIYDSNGKSHQATKIRQSEDNHLLILRFSTPRLFIDKLISFSNEQPLVGEPIILVGHHFNIVNSMSMGIIIAYEENELNSTELMLTNIPSDNYGDGGFLLNMNKQIIGIQYKNSDQITYVILSSTIKEFINSNE